MCFARKLRAISGWVAGGVQMITASSLVRSANSSHDSNASQRSASAAPAAASVQHRPPPQSVPI